MKALTYQAYGPLDSLRWETIPDLQAPAPGEILVHVRAVGLNPIDTNLATGKMPGILFRGWPKVPGYDVAGTVHAVGDGVERFNTGDRVAAMRPVRGPGGRALAESVLLDVDWAAKIPDGLSDVHAAGLPMAGLTAYEALTQKGRVDPGHKVLIIGAAGGVGHVAVQLAKAFGAQVTAMARATHHEFLRSLGCDDLLDYQTTPLSKLKAQFNLILDLGAKATLPDVRHLLTSEGTLVSTSPSPSVMLSSALNRLRRGPSAKFVNVSTHGAQLDLLLRWASEGRIRLYLNDLYPAERAVEALQYVDAGHTRGKVVVAMDDALIHDSK